METTTIQNKQWIYTKRPEGEVTEDHYQMKETTIDINDLKDGEILVQSKYISVDPYMRISQAASDTWDPPHPLGEVQGAGVVGEVIASKDTSGTIQVGDFVEGYLGWQTHGVLPAENARKLDPEIAPISTALGVLGMPGRTAYFGLLEAGKPKPGETVVVSGAAGAVGSIVAQIAKIKGSRVIGIASDKKLSYLVNELGIDMGLSYQGLTANEFLKNLKMVCPHGIDVYFDNVGGMITDSVFQLINLRARVVICGQISQYNGGLDNPEMGPRFLHRILYTRATIQGILARDFTPRMPEMLAEMGPWVREGKIKFNETIMEGFEKLPGALNALFHGTNLGKMLVKV